MELNEEVEEEQKQADGQEDGAAVDAAAGVPGQTADKAGGFGVAGHLFAEAVEPEGDRVTNDAAADGAKFVMYPNRNIPTVEPEKGRAASENPVTQKSKKSESRTGTPEHKDLAA